VLLRLLFVRARDVAAIDGALERAAARLVDLTDRLARTRAAPRRDGSIDVAAILRDAAARHADADLELLRRCRTALAHRSDSDERSTDPAVSTRETPRHRPPMRASVSRRDGHVIEHDRGARTAIQTHGPRVGRRRIVR